MKLSGSATSSGPKQNFKGLHLLTLFTFQSLPAHKRSKLTGSRPKLLRWFNMCGNVKILSVSLKLLAWRLRCCSWAAHVQICWTCAGSHSVERSNLCWWFHPRSVCLFVFHVKVDCQTLNPPSPSPSPECTQILKKKTLIKCGNGWDVTYEVRTEPPTSAERGLHVCCSVDQLSQRPKEGTFVSICPIIWHFIYQPQEDIKTAEEHLLEKTFKLERFTDACSFMGCCSMFWNYWLLPS